jgi:hypothetical protein
MTLEFKFKTSATLASADKELSTYSTMCQQVEAGVSITNIKEKKTKVCFTRLTLFSVYYSHMSPGPRRSLPLCA